MIMTICYFLESSLKYIRDFKRGKDTIPVEERITSVLTVNLLSQNNSVPINRLLERVVKISNYSDEITKVKGVIAQYFC